MYYITICFFIKHTRYFSQTFIYALRVDEDGLLVSHLLSSTGEQELYNYILSIEHTMFISQKFINKPKPYAIAQEKTSI